MPNLPRPRLRRAARARGIADASQGPAEPRVEIVEFDGLRWINIERPAPVDQAWLEEHFEFHPLDYEDVRSRNQRPKIDEYDDYLFIVLHFPVFDKQIGRLNGQELDIFMGPDYLITLPNAALQPVDYCFPMLRKIGGKLERLEEEIFLGRGDDVVRDLSNTKQEIINFRKVIRPQRTVLQDLERAKQKFLGDELDVYFDDVVDASERIWDMLENYKEVVEALEDTNESLISHRLNNVLRVLTSISVVILPLTLIASIWGMNVKIPGEGSIHAFWVIMIVMAGVLFSMLAFFRRRGWL